MMRTAAVLTVGSELTEGLRTDTNGPEISRRLSALGYMVSESVSAADDLATLSRCLRELCSVFELVVCTGGLGPTHDDVTRDAAADALDREMHPDAEMTRVLDDMGFPTHDPSIIADLHRQALVMDGGRLIHPVAGTAPAQAVDTPAGTLLLLPGPPAECMPLFEIFADELSGAAPAHADLSLFGLPESEVQHRVVPLLAEGEVEFTVLASPAGVHVLLTDRGCDEGRFEAMVESVKDALWPYLFTDEDKSLAEVVLDIARSKGMRIACAESCTGGKVAAALTDVPGSSDVFVGGIVSYTNAVKAAQLSVSSSDLDTYGAVSHQVAEQMAQGAREHLDADIAVSITGIAGPSGGSAEKPVGTVWFAVSDEDGTETVLRTHGGTRAAIRTRSMQTALDLLRRRMLSYPLSGSGDPTRTHHADQGKIVYP